MADRYAVATGNWNSTATWSTTSGGSPGASVPTLNDNVFLNTASGAITVTVSDVADCKNFDCSGFTGTFAGTFGLTAWGNVVTISSSMTYSYSSELAFSFAGAVTFTTNGQTITSSLNLRSAGVVLALNAALTTTKSILVNHGTFTTNNYAVTASDLTSNSSNARTINLGSSTVTLFGGVSVDLTTSTNLTFNAGTSSIVCSGSSSNFRGGSQTFYDVSYTATGSANNRVTGSNVFNNVSLAGRASAGVTNWFVEGNQTINGTLTLSAGANATARTFVRSNIIGTTRTLTCAAVASLTDIDFRDITIAGAAAPVSGTRLGDCKGNSGITFGAGINKYWNLAAGGPWSSAGWATSSGGSPAVNNFPLAQDTALFEATGLSSGSTITIDGAYNIGTINMSARTTNTIAISAFAAGAAVIYGNWINGTGTTLSGTGVFTFAGRGSQTITSAGTTFTQSFTVNTPGGSVTLQDAFVTNRNNNAAFALNAGTIDANGYNFSLTGAASSRFSSLTTVAKTIAIGSGTWTIAGNTIPWFMTGASSTTVTGTGTISLTGSSAKSFDGGNIQTYPTLNQGGTGTLTITGSNKFANITNTAIGRVQFTGGTTNEFTAFNLNGVSGNLLQLGSTNTTQVTLKAPSWNVGANSTDAGNNTGLSFIAGTVNYLSISYVIGVITAAPPTSTVYYGATNVTVLYYGGTPVSSMYYGSVKVF